MNPYPPQTTKKLFYLGLTLCGLFVLLLLVNRIFFGNAQPVSLSSGGLLDGRISQALISGEPPVSLPRPAADFSLKNTSYFENGTWAITTLVWKDARTDNGLIILKKTGGVYDIVLGPGTSFPASSTLSFPPGLVQYLNQEGVLYGSD